MTSMVRFRMLALAGLLVAITALPASARQTPLDTQERYDNLVFPRGGGPGQLTGRGGGPNPTTGREVFQ